MLNVSNLPVNFLLARQYHGITKTPLVTFVSRIWMTTALDLI